MDTNKKKSGVVILISDKVYVRAMNTTRTKGITSL